MLDELMPIEAQLHFQSCGSQKYEERPNYRPREFCCVLCDRWRKRLPCHMWELARNATQWQFCFSGFGRRLEISLVHAVDHPQSGNPAGFHGDDHSVWNVNGCLSSSSSSRVDNLHASVVNFTNKHHQLVSQYNQDHQVAWPVAMASWHHQW